MVRDGTDLPISHTGYVSLSTSHSIFQLNDVLCVPSIKKNLISIYQFCTSNDVSVEFFPHKFQVKDLCTKTPLHQGPMKDGVYEWPQNLNSTPPLLAFSTIKTSSSCWHQRLGHPAFPILQYIVKNNNLESSVSHNFSCNACSCNKAHRLPFYQSTLSTTTPLEIIFSDVWTSPILSIDNFKNYVVFIDHHTKYIWFYPLKAKSEVNMFLFGSSHLLKTTLDIKLKQNIIL